ncbi:MAG: GNAT family N-acetyltransferase [Synechococcaceae cyanobacterium ELA445]
MNPNPAADLEGLEVAPLGAADLDECLGLDRRALGGFWTPDQWRTELADPRRPCLGVFASASLVAMACGWLIVDELHISLVAVDPGFRRRGLGRRVTRALLEEALRSGAARATLEVAADNTAAEGLYGALGFRTAGRRCGYYRDGRDALIQWLNLLARGAGATHPEIDP